MNEVGHCLPGLPRVDRPTTLVQCLPIHTMYCANRTLLIIGGPFYRPNTALHRTSVLEALLLLFVGIEPNPGPPVKLGFINARSIVRRGPLICDMIVSHDLDVLAVAETWIRDDDPCAIKRDSAPSGYDIVHVPRQSHAGRSRGGGLCVIHRESVRVKPQRTAHYNSFECQLLKLVHADDKTDEYTTMAVIYRPLTTALNVFYNELSSLLDGLGDIIDRNRFVCYGDFNCGSDNQQSVCSDLLTLLDMHGLQRLVVSPTQRPATPAACLILSSAARV